MKNETRYFHRGDDLLSSLKPETPTNYVTCWNGYSKRLSAIQILNVHVDLRRHIFEIVADLMSTGCLSTEYPVGVHLQIISFVEMSTTCSFD